MPQSLARVVLQVVFSTKNRVPFRRDAAVPAYIADQEEHHRTLSFQDELRLLCRKQGLEIDERYVWD